LAHALEREPNVRLLRWLVSAVLIASLLSCVARGADNPADPSLGPVGAANRQLLPGFDETLVSVRSADGNLLSWCLLLALTTAQHERGLMTVTDTTLGGYDGMLFRFAADTTTPFWMRNTPMPLSIAYIDHTGALVSAADMAPCDDVDTCTEYPPAGPFRVAIEVPQGGLTRLGITPGATITDEQRGCS
jgi:uncharacterized membrane protein (UPF0127 family)